MSIKSLGPFRLVYGHTRWDQKTICFGGGKGFIQRRGEWYWFIGLNLWAVYVNVGIKKGWWKNDR